MLSKSQMKAAQHRAAEILEKCAIILTEEEKEHIEIAELGLNELEIAGLELVTYVNTDRYCAKELVMFPRQTCPEHKHPPLGPGKPGKWKHSVAGPEKCGCMWKGSRTL